MKALLLAAGLGSRLRPITDTLPKCLVPINGRPLLSYWMDLLEQHRVHDVLINLHHLPDPVRSFADAYSGPVNIHLVMEEELLGSAGTVWANRAFVEADEQFYILYADNLTNANLTALRDFNTEHPAMMTLGLFRAENPRACGIALLDQVGNVLEFEEKPENPKGDLASAGMFVARPALFRYVNPRSYPFDLGHHVLPRLLGVMNGVPIQGYLRDVGAHESLARAEREWQAL